MKSPTAFTLLALAVSTFSAPLEAELVPVIPTSPADNTTASIFANCIIRGYKSNNCGSGNIYAYDYVVDGCRSCRDFRTAHSFSLGDGCPRGIFKANQGVCSDQRSQFNIAFNGPGCYKVNTGVNWQSGFPCFYGFEIF